MTEANEMEAKGQEAEEQAPPKREAKPITISDLELEHLKREMHEYKDKYLRLLAENENTRKRLQKEKLEMTQYAIQEVMCEMLNPIDHMENALKYTDNATPEVKNWALGFQMILNQFKDVLNNHGVYPIESVGTYFDPHRQEAIETIETSDHPPGIVLSESVKGYKMHEKVIRPARVTVSKKPAAPQEIKNEEGV